MKTIGLIGGMSWESSAIYYQLLNTIVRSTVGGNANARSLMLTVDFARIEALQHREEWSALGAEMVDAATRLQVAGADCIVLCTNTMHKLAPLIADAISIPLLHIVDLTARRIKKAGFTRVGLLGTAFTMEDGFYQNRMKDDFAIDVITPRAVARREVHRIIYDELCCGITTAESRAWLLQEIEELQLAGAQAVILGCTELCLLLDQSRSSAPLFDSTRIHAEGAAQFYLDALCQTA